VWLLWLVAPPAEAGATPKSLRQQPSPTARAIAAPRTTCIATNSIVRKRNGRSISAATSAPPPILSQPLEGNHRISTGNMSLVNLAHVCSHLQNASKARLGLTSIPVSKMHVNLVLGLQREGFLSSVTLGGVSPPKPFLLQTQPDPEELEHLAEKLKTEPWQAFNVHNSLDSRKNREADLGQEKVEHVTVPQNPARRRLWLGLKYWNNEPVLKNMKLISKPTRRIWLTSQDLGKITRTRESSYVKGLTHPGECMFLTTDRGILEARECVERQLGGMALCRVW
jgi:ribosomal protein S8